jgi:hypothetical protein
MLWLIHKLIILGAISPTILLAKWVGYNNACVCGGVFEQKSANPWTNFS